MKNFKVVFRAEDFQGSKDFGRICLLLDDYAFPEKEWTDFGRTIIPWWLDAVRRIYLSETALVCSFMDGPYRFLIEKKDSSIWSVKFLEEREKTQTLAEGKVQASNVTAEILSAYDQVITLYKAEGDNDKEAKLKKLRGSFLSVVKNNI